MQRMQNTEKSLKRSLDEIGSVSEDMDRMKRMVIEMHEEMDKSSKSEIKEALEPVIPFLNRGKVEAELDDFIGYMLNYSG